MLNLQRRFPATGVSHASYETHSNQKISIMQVQLQKF